MKHVIFAVVGFALGYVTCLAVREKHYVKQYAELIEEVREHYAAKYTNSEMPDEDDDDLEAMSDYVAEDARQALMVYRTDTEIEDEDEESPESSRSPAEARRTFIEYHKMHVSAGEVEKVTLVPVDDSVSLPFRISEHDFMSSTSEFAQAALDYYTEDDVLTDQKHEVFNDSDRMRMVGGTIGVFRTDATDAMYVRSEITRREYEVFKIVGSYEKLLDDEAESG